MPAVWHSTYYISPFNRQMLSFPLYLSIEFVYIVYNITIIFSVFNTPWKIICWKDKKKKRGRSELFASGYRDNIIIILYVSERWCIVPIELLTRWIRQQTVHCYRIYKAWIESNARTYVELVTKTQNNKLLLLKILLLTDTR